MGKHQRPSIFGLDDPDAWFGKAERELIRYEVSEAARDKIDHIINFSIAISHVAEWHWCLTLKHHPRWKHLSLSAFRRYVFAMEPALGYMETLCIASKHPELDSHDPEFRDATASMVLLEALPMPDDPTRARPVILSEDYNFLGGDHFESDFLGLALASLEFWRRFDPDHSPV